MRHFLLAHRAPLLTGLILLLLWGLFASISPVTFFHGRIYTSLLSTIPLTILLALGMTLLIIAREIDMSFPAVIALGGFIFAWLFQHTGSPLLAGRGPCLHVRMQSVGTATARFDNQFSSAGINQTRHRILLDVDVHVSILLPGLTTYTKVSNEISVAETVIVGGVPDTYTYFSTTPDEIENYADEYIINNG